MRMVISGFIDGLYFPRQHEVSTKKGLEDLVSTQESGMIEAVGSKYQTVL